MSAPAAPVTTSTLDFTGAPSELAADGQLVVVSVYGNPVRVFVLDDTGVLSPGGTITGEGRFLLEGSRLHLITGSVYSIMDLADPAAPALVGDLRLSSIAGFPVRMGHHVVLMSSRASPMLVDISNPSAPSLSCASLQGLHVNGGRMATKGDVLFACDVRPSAAGDAACPPRCYQGRRS